MAGGGGLTASQRDIRISTDTPLLCQEKSLTDKIRLHGVWYNRYSGWEFDSYFENKVNNILKINYIMNNVKQKDIFWHGNQFS